MGGRGIALVVVVAVACGGGTAPPPPPQGPTDLTARPTGPDDPVVARVDGRPVYASCVEAQARGRRLDRQAALADCVDLELLAGAALARGLDRDPEVAAAGRDAAAVRFLDVEYRARYRRFDDLPAALRERTLAKVADRRHRPESRASYLARVEVPKGGRPGPVDDAAHRAIDLAYATLGPRHDLYPQDLEPALKAAVAAVDPGLTTLVGSAVPTEEHAGLLEYYRQALFSIPEVGQVAPPVANPWGWDIILYTDFRRPPDLTDAEFEDKLFPAARQLFFNQWLDRLARGHQVEVAAPEVLERLWGDAAAAGGGPG